MLLKEEERQRAARSQNYTGQTLALLQTSVAMAEKKRNNQKKK